MEVGIFYNSISNPGKFSNKVMLMDNFAQGVRNLGDDVIDYRGNQLPDRKLDAGFVLGYTLEDNFRKKIIQNLIDSNTPQVYVDSNILHYARSEHEWHRYSLNSVYPDSGIYFFSEPTSDKWKIYSQWHNVDLKPWRTDGRHILILCQRPKGWNMFGNDQEDWLDQIIARIRIHSDRPLVVRLHPGDGTRTKTQDKLRKKYGDSIEISQQGNIREDLENCWACVGYNSTPNVVAAIEGVPVYVDDPVHSWAQEIAMPNISKIEDPPLPDRTDWANRIANIHWSNQEVKTGVLWRSIKDYISSAL